MCEVQRSLEDLEQQLRIEETHVLTLSHEIRDLTSLLDRLEGEKREADKQAMTSGHMLQQLDVEMQRSGERLETARLELQRLGIERGEIETTIQDRKSNLATAEDRRIALEQQIVFTQDRLNGLRTARDAASQSTSLKVAKAAALEERHRSATAGLQRIESLVAEMRERVHALQSQIESAAAEKLQRQVENQQLGEQVVAFETERNAGEAREGLLQFESEQVRARLLEIDETLRNSRQLLDQARDRRGELSASAAKLQSDLQYMSESCLNELGVER